MTKDEAIALAHDAFGRCVDKYIGSPNADEIDACGRTIAEQIRAQSDVLAAEYDPATRAVNVTLAPVLLSPRA
jgi:hypothetical protein